MIQQAHLKFPAAEINEWIETKKAFIEKDHLKLTTAGKLLADKLSADIFYLSEQ